jgi:hypothetical protein
MTTNLRILTPSGTIRLVIENPATAPRMFEDFGDLITVRVATDGGSRTLTAWLAPALYKPEVRLNLWQQGTFSTELIATTVGEAASMKELLLELTEGFAPQLTDAVNDCMSLIGDQWQAYDRQTSDDSI